MEDLGYKLLKSSAMFYSLHVSSTRHVAQQTQIATGVFAGWVGDNQKEIYLGTNSPPLRSLPPNNKRGENSVDVHWCLRTTLPIFVKVWWWWGAGRAHETQDQREVCWRGHG